MATRKNRKNSRSFTRNNTGRFTASAYHAKKTVGSRAEVWHGTAKKTYGGLTRADLMKNKHGRIVSIKKSNAGKKTIKRLKNLGFVAKKGEFKLFKKSDAKVTEAVKDLSKDEDKKDEEDKVD